MIFGKLSYVIMIVLSFDFEKFWAQHRSVMAILTFENGTKLLIDFLAFL
jgi:hypothetical protein